MYLILLLGQYITVSGKDGKSIQFILAAFCVNPCDMELLYARIRKSMKTAILLYSGISAMIFFVILHERKSNGIILAIVLSILAIWIISYQIIYHWLKNRCANYRAGAKSIESRNRKRKPKTVKSENESNAVSYKKPKHKRLALISLIAGIVILCIGSFIGVGYSIDAFLVQWAPFEITENVSDYSNVIGENARGVYQNKWGIDEDIFPEDITGYARDFKMVFYDPWDAQYLSYLVVDYEDDALRTEENRLKKYGIEEYEDNYGASGFLDEYELLAMNSDAYHGFIYALKQENTIIYVEIIFCNYFMDIDYLDYINEDYLPVGFDATVDNPHAEKMREQQGTE